MNFNPDIKLKIDLSVLMKAFNGISLQANVLKENRKTLNRKRRIKKHVLTAIKTLSGEELIAELKAVELLQLDKKRKNREYIQKIPWRHDFVNNCVKCNSTYHLQRHHITYDPELIVFLCQTCHKKVTKLNTLGSYLVGGNLKTRKDFTNKLRATLWRWFETPTWTLDKLKTKDFLQKSGFSLVEN